MRTQSLFPTHRLRIAQNPPRPIRHDEYDQYPDYQQSEVRHDALEGDEILEKSREFEQDRQQDAAERRTAVRPASTDDDRDVDVERPPRTELPRPESVRDRKSVV